MATIRRDGTIDFNLTGGLLSVESVTLQALRLLEGNLELSKRFDEVRRIETLRKSCGVPMPKTTIRIKKPEKYHG